VAYNTKETTVKRVQNFGRKSQMKTPLVRLECGYEDNIKVYLKARVH
jgi:hypothetical protein